MSHYISRSVSILVDGKAKVKKPDLKAPLPITSTSAPPVPVPVPAPVSSESSSKPPSPSPSPSAAPAVKKDTVEAVSTASTQEMQDLPAATAVTIAVPAAAPTTVPAVPAAVLGTARAPTPPPAASFSSSAGMDIDALFASSPLLSPQDKVENGVSSLCTVMCCHYTALLCTALS